MLKRKDFKMLCVLASIFISYQITQAITIPRELAADVPEVVSLRYGGIDGIPRKIEGKEMRWRACSGVVFSKKEQSCALTTGHCMGGILGMGRYTQRADDAVLKNITFESANGKKAKIDATDLNKNVKILNAVVPPSSDKTPKEIIDSEIARLTATGQDLAIVKLNAPLKGFSFEELVPKSSPQKTEFQGVKGFLIGAGTMLPIDQFFKSQWPVRNQQEQKLHYCKQTYWGEISELSLKDQYKYLVGADATQVEKEFASEMQRLHEELLKRKPGVILLGAEVQQLGYGDSGGPFFMLDKNKKKKIYGLATASNAENRYTELVSVTGETQRTWISDHLKEMGCN